MDSSVQGMGYVIDILGTITYWIKFNILLCGDGST